jgi:hypothetical protein
VSGLPRVLATRYVTPFREGGSLPALVEVDGGRHFVVKLAGAGQGPRALVAEIIAGELARAAGLSVPELALVTLEDALARSERDQEIQDLLRASIGENLGLAYLGGALGHDPAADGVDAELAARIVILDAFVMNVDRTPRNPNLLWWRGALWLIDHGASLYFHHAWDGGRAGSDRPFPQSKDHVLLPHASAPALRDAGEALAAAADDATLARIVDLVPAAWRAPRAAGEYVAYLAARRDARAGFVDAAIAARHELEEAGGARARRV